jgi:putative tryptophan/tyrosine transport system substrate-binding protein
VRSDREIDIYRDKINRYNGGAYHNYGPSKRGATLERRVLFIISIFLILMIVGCAQKAQEQKVYRVGVLSGAPPFYTIADGFQEKMTELGYLEDTNIVYDVQKSSGDPAEQQRMIDKFVADDVDLIFAFPTEPAVLAKASAQGTGIPVVFAMAGIDGTDLVNSVSRPGGNITGVRFPGPELTVKRLEFLHEIAPNAKRIYLIYDQNYPNVPMALGGLRSTAPSMNLTLVEDLVNNLEELNAALDTRNAQNDIGIDAILILPEILTQTPDGFGSIVRFADENKIPIGGSLDFTADLGAVFSYVPDNNEQGAMAAMLADKIFKGTPPGTIPVVTPEGHLRINYNVTQKLGLNVSEGLLRRADEIIR